MALYYCLLEESLREFYFLNSFFPFFTMLVYSDLNCLLINIHPRFTLSKKNA